MTDKKVSSSFPKPYNVIIKIFFQIFVFQIPLQYPYLRLEGLDAGIYCYEKLYLLVWST